MKSTVVPTYSPAHTALCRVVYSIQGLQSVLLVIITCLLYILFNTQHTVEPPKKGHFGNGTCVLSSEVVLISEVHEIFYNFITFYIMWWNISDLVKFVHELVCKIVK